MKILAFMVALVVTVDAINFGLSLAIGALFGQTAQWCFILVACALGWATGTFGMEHAHNRWGRS